MSMCTIVHKCEDTLGREYLYGHTKGKRKCKYCLAKVQYYVEGEK